MMKNSSAVNMTEPSEDEMKMINKLSRKELSPDDVYIFSVVLCDNEIDRDNERFSVQALYDLADMYVGKTGIFDHSMKSSDQTARIFSTEVEKVGGKKTKAGEDYYRLKAKAYMPKTEKNSDLIAEIDAGIKKEVSVGCAVGEVICSVCGADVKRGSCGHIRGKKYSGKVCHAILNKPTDAYEWSFVAVPAQPQAGVVKAYNPKGGGEMSLENITQVLKNADGEVRLSKDECTKLLEHIENLSREASVGTEYHRELQREVVRLCSISMPEIGSDLMKNISDKMSVDELKGFKKALAAKADEIIPPSPQLAGMKKKNAGENNSEFKI